MKDQGRDHLDRIKAAMSGNSIAARLGLQGRGKRFRCPFCVPSGGKKPDLSLAVGDQGFVCHRCGIKGDLLNLVEIVQNVSFPSAVAWLENETGIRPDRRRESTGEDLGRRKIVDPGPSRRAVSAPKVPDPPKGDHSALYEAFLRSVCIPLKGTRGAAYLEKRGIDPEVAGQYGVRYCPDLTPLWSLADRATIEGAGLSSLYLFQQAGLPFLVFPYLRQGRPVMIKSRCLLSKKEADKLEVPRFLNSSGKVPSLWNHDAVPDADQVMICEGEIDALSAIIAGFTGVGLPGWAHWKDEWTKDFTGKDIVLVLDADEAGRKGTADIARRFMKAGLPCPRQLILEDGKDLNDVIQDFMNA